MKKIRPYFQHIEEYIRRLHVVLGESSKDAFLNDFRVHDLVIQELTQIGQSVRKLPDEFKKQHPEIPWQDIIDFRNVLVHNYEGVELKSVWDVVENDIPHLKKFVTDYLEQNT